MDEEFKEYLVALDIELLQVGCPLLQAAMGGSSRMLDLVPIESWLLYPTDNLKVYRIGSLYMEKLVSERVSVRAQVP